MDIGTGGGFPGIPLSIARPDTKFLLMDSIAKKIKITAMFAQHTASRDISAVCGRVEGLHEDPSKLKSFDYIFVRAVTRTKELFEWSDPLLHENGKIILLKGGDLTEEIADAQWKFPNYEIKEIPIKIIGCPWFASEEKKLLICSRNKSE